MNTFSRFSAASCHPDTPSTGSSANSKALEIRLHDSLDRLEDFTLMMAFQSSGYQFDILSITPPTDIQPPASSTTPVARTPALSDRKVVDIQSVALRKTA